MRIRRSGLAVAVFLIGALAVVTPAFSQTVTCSEQSATGHIEVIGTVPNVNLGRHIIYSFSAIQTGEVDDDGSCAVHRQIQEFLYDADPGGDLSKRGDLLRRSHGDVVCIGIGPDPSIPRPGEPPRLEGVAHMAAQITSFYLPPEAPPPEPVYWIWKVQDNGEGPDDPPDFGSALAGVPGARAFAFCKLGDARAMAPSIRGNVQVRPPDLP